MLYWVLKKIFVGPWIRLIWRPRVEGIENLPKNGPAILAGNHLSFADHFFMPLYASRKVTFFAKQEYFTGRGLKGRLTRMFFSGVGQVPIDRRGGSAAKATLETGKRILADGRLLGIYPEGTRSPDGRLYRGKTGVARLALEAGVPVIPAAVIGTDKVMPIGARFPRLRKVTIRFGTPLDFSRYEGMSGDRFVERSMTDEIMYELMLLSGQEYVDVYAAKVKSDREAAGAGGLPDAAELDDPPQRAPQRGRGRTPVSRAS